MAVKFFDSSNEEEDRNQHSSNNRRKLYRTDHAVHFLKNKKLMQRKKYANPNYKSRGKYLDGRDLL